MNRFIVLGLVAALLTACDGPDKSPGGPNEPQPPKPTAGVPATPADAGKVRIDDVRIAPSGQPLPVGKPLVESKPKAEAPARTSVPVARNSTAEAKRSDVRQPEAKLDLSLPHEALLVEQPKPGPIDPPARVEKPKTDASLLPPLFGARKNTDAFELGAQLITDQNIGSAKDDPVQGAELHFTFNR